MVSGRMASVRVDQWLWAARAFKTRSLATAACSGGHVKVNDRTAKASKLLKVGDRVEALAPGGLRIFEVVVLSSRRGPASVAQTLYEDFSPPPPPRAATPVEIAERGAGRPTKRRRRELRRLKGR